MDGDRAGENGVEDLGGMREGCDDEAIGERLFGGFEEGVHRGAGHSLDVFDEDEFCGRES